MHSPVARTGKATQRHGTTRLPPPVAHRQPPGLLPRRLCQGRPLLLHETWVLLSCDLSAALAFLPHPCASRSPLTSPTPSPDACAVGQLSVGAPGLGPGPCAGRSFRARGVKCHPRASDSQTRLQLRPAPGTGSQTPSGLLGLGVPTAAPRRRHPLAVRAARPDPAPPSSPAHRPGRPGRACRLRPHSLPYAARLILSPLPRAQSRQPPSFV